MPRRLEKKNRFAGEDFEEVHEDLSRVNEIISLFQALDFSKDHVMMMAFPYSLKGKRKMWIKKLPEGLITNWDSLKKAFLKEYRTPSKILQQREETRNFQQSPNESLFSTWERFEDLLFKYPEHKLNKYDRLQIFYNGLQI